MPGEANVPSWVLDPHVPNVARMYDYYLGGKDNYAADRAAADQVVAAVPYIRDFTRANRRFLVRAVTLLAERGVRQFLDLGSGLPTRENVHEAARRVAPGARTVYVDHDPVVLAHGRALLAGDPLTTVVQADLRDPKAVLEHPEVRSRIDFGEPVAVLLLAVLHFVPADEEAAAIVAALREPLAAGGHLVVSHGHAGRIDKDAEARVRGAYRTTAPGDIVPRSPEQIASYFEGMEILAPGVVPVEAWRPEDGAVEADPSKAGILGAVGVKR
ncbi:SAM-dependent methyltransferase [Spirillospora sp. CA-253888]